MYYPSIHFWQFRYAPKPCSCLLRWSASQPSWYNSTVDPTETYTGNYTYWYFILWPTHRTVGPSLPDTVGSHPNIQLGTLSQALLGTPSQALLDPSPNTQLSPPSQAVLGTPSQTQLGTLSQTIVKQSHGQSPASSPHKLGKEGPKRRTVTVRKLSASLKPDKRLPSLQVKLNLQETNTKSKSKEDVHFQFLSYVFEKYIIHNEELLNDKVLMTFLCWKM